MNRPGHTFPLAVLLAACARQPQVRSRASDSSAYCPARHRLELRVTEPGIDGFSFDSSIGLLKTLCPTARDTFVPSEVGRTPAVFLPLRGATVLAVQWSDSLDLALPADVWEIRGDSVVLPRGLSLRTEWASLRRAYGRAQGDLPSEDWVHFLYFWFCNMPNVVFELPNIGLDSTADMTDPASIPPTAHPTAVDLVREVKFCPSER